MGKHSADRYQVVISEAELRQRIAALGHQISEDFKGRAVLCVGVLEDGFIFVADLLREITCDVRCQFVKPFVRELYDQDRATTEIFYSPEVDIEGQHVLLCEAILSTGQTTDFLLRNFQARGAASISLCALLDRQADRRVDLQVAYSGFQVGPQRLAGFGLGSPALNRNCPFIFAAPDLHVVS
jgi:hypoxanthine phosphoribosyltransferase